MFQTAGREINRALCTTRPVSTMLSTGHRGQSQCRRYLRGIRVAQVQPIPTTGLFSGWRRCLSLSSGRTAASSAKAAVVKETLVFSCNKDRFVFLLKAAALAQGVFLLNVAWMASEMQVDWSDGAAATSAEDRAPSNGTELATQPPHAKSGTALGWGFAVGAMLLVSTFVGGTAFITRRLVHSITVVEGALARDRMVKVVTYAVFGKRTLNVLPTALRFDTSKFANELKGTGVQFAIAGKPLRLTLLRRLPLPLLALACTALHRHCTCTTTRATIVWRAGDVQCA
jgi:hypothetical protein